MPLLLLPWIGGALLGGGTVWVTSEASKKLMTAAILAGGAYYLYKKAN